MMSRYMLLKIHCKEADRQRDNRGNPKTQDPTSAAEVRSAHSNPSTAYHKWVSKNRRHCARLVRRAHGPERASVGAVLAEGEADPDAARIVRFDVR